MNYMKCPFCEEGEILVKSGPVLCPNCMASFRIDDREESIFVDLNRPRIPLRGTYCPHCGLVQGHENEHCYFCAGPLDVAEH